MVFVTLQLPSFIQQRVGWRIGLGTYCLLSVVMLVSFSVICLVWFRTLKNGKCVTQTWETGAACGIRVQDVGKSLWKNEVFFFFCQFKQNPKVQLYGGLNVLLQSARLAGFRMLFNVFLALGENNIPFTQHRQSFIRLTCTIDAYSCAAETTQMRR